MYVQQEALGTPSELQERFAHFKERYHIQDVVAVIGGSEEQHLYDVEAILLPAFTAVAQQTRFAVLTGGTKGGIPELTLRVAKNLELPTMAVFPEKGAKHVLYELLDFLVAVPSPIYGDTVWGSETPVLASFPDVAVLIGGAWGTAMEVSTIMKNNVSRIKHGEKPTILIPILDTGGTAAWLEYAHHFLPIPEGTVRPANDADSLAAVLGDALNKNVFAKLPVVLSTN